MNTETSIKITELHDKGIVILNKINPSNYNEWSSQMMNAVLCGDGARLRKIIESLEKLERADTEESVEEKQESTPHEVKKKKTQKEQILEIYKPGMSVAQITKITGFSYAACRHAIKDKLNEANKK